MTKNKKILQHLAPPHKKQNGLAIDLTNSSIHHRLESSDAYYNQGNALYGQGKLEEAIASYRQALTLRPDYVEALYNLGNTLYGQGKLEEAITSYRQALTLKPDFVKALYNLAITLYGQGKLEEAIASYRKALTLKPDYVKAHNNLGDTLYVRGKLEEAIASYRKALTLKPDYVEAHNNLGNALKEQGKFEEAVASYRQALTLKPDYVEAHSNLGNALKRQGKFEEAITSYRQALTLKPDYVEAHNNLGNALREQGKLEEAITSYRQALTLKPGYFDAHSNLLFCLKYIHSQSVSQYLDEARHYGRTVTDTVHTRFLDWSCSMKPERLYVGLVSGDFRAHSVGYFLENLLTNINPNKIDLIAYETYQNDDELTKRIHSRFTAWKPLLGMKDEDAARMIHNDGVHILLDLSGHTAHNRLPVFAWKPAPVQVNWLGYSASTGLAEMDYLLADPYIVPSSEEANFTETIWRLPDSYLCFTPPLEKIVVGSLPALKNGMITFGCFNNPTKMNELVIALWVRVLHSIPRSRLFLKSMAFSNLKFCENTLQRFAAFDISPERILFESFDSQREKHLAAYNHVDIALDPFPYNGTTTSIEGLWMGVPFITLKGNRFVSHVGESIAHNAGLPDWIAIDEDDYVTKAKAFSSNLDKLSELRTGLRQQVLASPIFDGHQFARNFENAMWGMWHKYQNKQ